MGSSQTSLRFCGRSWSGEAGGALLRFPTCHFQIRPSGAAGKGRPAVKPGACALSPRPPRKSGVPGLPRTRRKGGGRGGRAEALIGPLEARLAEPLETPVAGSRVSFIPTSTEWVDSRHCPRERAVSELVLGAGIRRCVGLQGPAFRRTAVPPPVFAILPPPFSTPGWCDRVLAQGGDTQPIFLQGPSLKAPHP